MHSLWSDGTTKRCRVTRIPVGTQVVVTGKGLRGKKRKGSVVAPELVKGYNVQHTDDGTVDRYPDKKVRVSESLRLLLKAEHLAERMAAEVLVLPRPEPVSHEVLDRLGDEWNHGPVAQPKPPAPRRSKSYLAYVRKLDCCNCGTPGPSDPHHEGKRGVGQKTSDMLVIPLCRRCHSIYTDENQLPRCVDGKDKGRFDREESLRVLHGAQANLLTMVLERLLPGKRAEVLAAAVASLDDATLAGVLKS